MVQNWKKTSEKIKGQSKELSLEHQILCSSNPQSCVRITTPVHTQFGIGSQVSSIYARPRKVRYLKGVTLIC